MIKFIENKKYYQLFIEGKAMSQNTEPISPSFYNILELVKQGPIEDKIKLSKELEKETKETLLTELLEAFKTDELSLETITSEVKSVRAEMYAKKETT